MLSSGTSQIRPQAQGQSRIAAKRASPLIANPVGVPTRPTANLSGWSPSHRERPASRRMISTQPSGVACCSIHASGAPAPSSV
jgi:hypothetical protein